jgi:hypothetical protein
MAEPPVDDTVANEHQGDKVEEPKMPLEEMLKVKEEKKEEENDLVESTRLSLSNLLNPNTWDLPGWESGNTKYVPTPIFDKGVLTASVENQHHLWFK